MHEPHIPWRDALSLRSGTATNVAWLSTICRDICGRDQKWKNDINGI